MRDGDVFAHIDVVDVMSHYFVSLGWMGRCTPQRVPFVYFHFNDARNAKYATHVACVVSLECFRH